MLFHSAEFIFVFLPLAGALYYFTLRCFGGDAALAAMSVASLVFYAHFHAPDVVLLCGSITFNYLIGERLRVTKSRGLLAVAILANLATLIFFKYFGLLARTVTLLTDAPIAVTDLALPLAISFFTFQQIAYLVDVRDGASPRYSLLRYSFFITFFPHLIAGPILHHRQILPQLSELRFKRHQMVRDLSIGSTLFAIGLFKKVGIADSVAPFADRVFGAATPTDVPVMIDCWVGAFAYSMQIYFDFSGYSDMAIGLSRMLGIRLPLNFFSPYQASSVIEFWRRWHITLSRFLKNYLYIPLGGNRHGPRRRYVNIFIVMALGGLWHGADWAFALWGGLHGLFLGVNHAWRQLVGEGHNGLVARIAGWMLTMTAVVVAWVPFRAADISTTLTMYRSMFGFDGLRLGETSTLILGDGWRLLHNFGIDLDAATPRITQHGWLVLAAAVAFFAPNAYQLLGRYSPAWGYTQHGASGLSRLWQWRAAWPLGAGIASLAALAFLGQSRSISFLYFQF